MMLDESALCRTVNPLLHLNSMPSAWTAVREVFVSAHVIVMHEGALILNSATCHSARGTRSEGIYAADDE